MLLQRQTPRREEEKEHDREKEKEREREREKGENRKQTFYLRDSFPFFFLCSTGIRRIGCYCRHRSRRKKSRFVCIRIVLVYNPREQSNHPLIFK